MAEEERKDAMMALGRIVLAIEGLKMDYKQDVQTIIYALQSPPVPVIDGLDNDIEHIEYLYEKERSDFINTASPMFLRFMQAARAYAELQKGV